MAATTTDRKSRRTGIKLIDDRKKRDVTFSKRKTGLFKKSAKLSASQPSAQVAVLVFSQTGNLFSFADPDLDAVINRYVNGNNGGVVDSGNNGCVVDSGDDNQGFWWDRVKIDDLGTLEELEGFKKSLQEVKNRAFDRILTVLSDVELDDSEVGTFATDNFSTYDDGSTSKSVLVDSSGSEFDSSKSVFDHDFSQGGFLSLDDLNDDLKQLQPGFLGSDVFSLEELGLI